MQSINISKKLETEFYFANPYSSWGGGLNEYTNKLIRQYIPKKDSFDKYNKQDIKQVQYELNKRPRKNLKFKTPQKIFFASLLKKFAFSLNLRNKFLKKQWNLLVFSKKMRMFMV